MTGGRLALRLARREVWRRPGRTALVALLVALPVAAMASALVLIRSDRDLTEAERWRHSNGDADAMAWGAVAETADGGPTSIVSIDSERGLIAVVPSGARTLPVAEWWQRARAADGRRTNISFTDLPLLDPMTSAIYRHLDGRAPAAAGEVVLTQAAARRFGVAVGESLELTRPKVALAVTGLVERPDCLSCLEVIVAPGRLGETIPAASGATNGYLLVDLPALASMTADEVAAVLEAGSQGGLGLSPEWAALSPDVSYWYGHDDGASIRWSFVIGALVLTVVGIVISAAFAVGARRQLVTLGQLSASGAPPSTIRLALVLQGTVTGLVGAATGLLTAGLGLLAAEGLVERVLNRRIDGYTVRAADIVLVVAIGTVAATVAALIPARSAAGIPTLAALAGRRPLHPVPRRLVGWGAAAFCGGLGLLGLAVVGAGGRDGGGNGELWAYVAILGGVTELLGACAVAPALVTRLEPLAARLRGSWRLGARSLARHRSRTGAVVSAVAAAGALAIASAALLIGSERRAGDDVSVPDDVVAAQQVAFDPEEGHTVSTGPLMGQPRVDLLAALPGADEIVVDGVLVRPVSTGTDDGTSAQWTVTDLDTGVWLDTTDLVIVPDDDILDVLALPGRARDALAAGELVVLTDQAGGPVDVQLPDGRSFSAVRSPRRHSLGWLDRVLVPRERALEMGLDVQPVASVFRNGDPLTDVEREDLEEIFYYRSGDEGIHLQANWHTPSGGPTPFQIELILTGLALLFSLFVVGVSLALAAAESHDERDVLTVAGAPPGALARSAGARAWLLAAIGGLMAIPVGFLPVVVFARATSTDAWSVDFPIVFPTRTALVLLVVVPSVVALAAWAASTTAQRLRPVRVSTATFE